MKNGEAALTIQPVVNYKQISQVAVFCPFSKKFLVTGVNTNVHAAVPVKAEVTMKDGQYSVIVSTPKDEESQKEKPVFQLRVKPYTAAYDMTSSSLVTVDKAANSKIIKSRNQQQRKEYQLGQALGLNLKLKIETEQPHVDLAEFVQGLLQHKPLTLLTLPLPLKTVRDHSVSLIYNPRDSYTKDASLSFSFGYGQKLQSGLQPQVTSHSTVTVPDLVERQCREEARRWKEEEQRDAGKIQERKERCVRRNQERCQQDKEQEQRRQLAGQEKEECRREVQNKCELEKENELKQDEVEKKEKCEREKVAVEEKEKCMREQSMQSRPFSEVESYCSKQSVQYKQRHTSSKSNMKSLMNILNSIKNAARAVSINVQAALHGENFSADRKIQAQGRLEEHQLKLKVSVVRPGLEKPYDLVLDAVRKIQRPNAKWDKEAMLQQDLSAQIKVKSQAGQRNEQQNFMQLNINFARTAEQKAWAKSLTVWKMCDSDLAKKQQLSENCQEARHHAARLDRTEADVSLPKHLTRHPLVSTLASLAKAYFMPYLAIESSTYNRQSATHDHFKVDSLIAPNGKSVTVSVVANKE